MLHPIDNTLSPSSGARQHPDLNQHHRIMRSLLPAETTSRKESINLEGNRLGMAASTDRKALGSSNARSLCAPSLEVLPHAPHDPHLLLGSALNQIQSFDYASVQRCSPV